MMDSQNSTGFFATKLISEKSLISNIPNFDFQRAGITPFSDAELKIPERLMLGKRAERYFSDWINQSPEFELVAENIQVYDQKQTLGEFDFIVRRNADQQLIHIELVYKFYLFDPSVEGKEFEHWIGPNRGDQLDLKIQKLKDHQFPLLRSKAASDTLKRLGIDTSAVEQHVLFFANLFVPLNRQVDFQKVNKGAIEGRWMNLNDWEANSDANAKFAIPAKVDWFARELQEVSWLTKVEALAEINSMHERKRSPLVYSKDELGNQRRDFVVWW